MNSEDALREWFISLSEMIGGNIEPDATLGAGLDWFGSLSDETLAQVQRLGRDNPSIESFLELGRHLLHEVAE